MATAVFRPAALLVLATFAFRAHGGHDGGPPDDPYDAQPTGSTNAQPRQESYYDSGDTGSQDPNQAYYDTQSSNGDPDYYDQQPADIAQNYYDTQPTDGQFTTRKPGFMMNSSPKNRAIVTGVVAGAGVAAVAGGIAIAIEEHKIQKNIREGKAVKPLFPWLGPKQHGGNNPFGGGPSVGSSDHSSNPAASEPRISARESTGDKGGSAEAPAPSSTPVPTLPPTTTPGPTTTAPARLGDEIPLPVWIALGVLALCCLAALVCACVEAIRHGGKKKRSKVVSQSKRSEREVSRSDSVDSYNEGLYDEGSYYSDQAPNYAAVAPQDQFYDSGAAAQYSYDYSQQGSYQTSAQSSYAPSTAQLSYADYAPSASYALTDASQYSAQSYVPSLHHNPHPNAHAYVNPNDGLYHYNTNT